MGKVVVETFIAASPEVCFDLARNTKMHAISAADTDEVVLSGVELLTLGDTVTFRGRHFGFVQEVTAKISAYDRPYFFQDIQVRGIFRRFSHDHVFRAVPGGTLMTDVFEYECPLKVLNFTIDGIVRRHLRKFLVKRNQILKQAAEGFSPT